MTALIAKDIESAKPRAVKYEIVDSTRERGVGRLVLRVSPTGSKEFSYKYRFEGNRHYISLGKFPSLSLAVARDRIQPLIALIREGKNPKLEISRNKQDIKNKEEAEAKQGSIKQLFKAYTDKMKADDKRTYQAVLRGLEKEVYPHIAGNVKAKDILPTDIVPILSVMISRGAATQSNRIRSYLVAAFNFGLKHDLDPATQNSGVKFGLLTNPAQVVPRQESAERVGENWLRLDTVRQLFADLSTRDGYKMSEQMSLLIKLCFFTGGQRPYELISSRWDVIDWDAKTWMIESSISKNKKQHLIPLSETALICLERLKALDHSDSDFIFSYSGRQQHIRTDSLAKALARFRAARPDFPKFIPRDIRRTVKTLMGELGISKEIRDRLQNHALNDVSSKHYDRYSYLPEKRAAIEAWDNRLNQITTNDNVTQMERKSA
jgi:integrase